MSTPDLLKNILCLLQAQNGRLKHDAQADVVGISSSTLARWKSGHGNPSPKNLNIVSSHYGVTAATLRLPHSEFLTHPEVIPLLDSSRLGDVAPTVALPAVLKWRYLWESTFEQYRGAYLVYTPVLSGPFGSFAVAALQIRELTPRGIAFELLNIDDRYPDEPITRYEYSGLMFPIRGSLSFYGSDKYGDEPLFIILDALQPNPPRYLCGYLSAIAVSARKQTAKSARTVFQFLGRAVSEISILGRLGVRQRDVIPPSVVDLLLGADREGE